jgi:predicted MFS family arabinose efflux permease
MKYKKFMGNMLIMFAWNYIANLNNGLWHYYLLNNVGFNYGTITLAAGLNGACVLLTTSLWRRVLYRLSWLRTFAFSVLLLVPLEIAFFFVTKHTTWLYLPLAVLFHIASVGVNLSYANVLYLNLPRENSTTHISFQAVFSNICAFLGLMSGTLWCKLFGEDTVIYIGSLPTTAVQYTTLFRAAALLILGVVVYKNWERLTPESELELLKLKNNNFSSNKEDIFEEEDEDD